MIRNSKKINLRNKRPTAADLAPTSKAIKEMSYEQMETLWQHRKERLKPVKEKLRSESWIWSFTHENEYLNQTFYN